MLGTKRDLYAGDMLAKKAVTVHVGLRCAFRAILDVFVSRRNFVQKEKKKKRGREGGKRYAPEVRAIISRAAYNALVR